MFRKHIVAICIHDRSHSKAPLRPVTGGIPRFWPETGKQFQTTVVVGNEESSRKQDVLKLEALDKRDVNCMDLCSLQRSFHGHSKIACRRKDRVRSDLNICKPAGTDVIDNRQRDVLCDPAATGHFSSSTHFSTRAHFDFRLGSSSPTNRGAGESEGGILGSNGFRSKTCDYIAIDTWAGPQSSCQFYHQRRCWLGYHSLLWSSGVEG